MKKATTLYIIITLAWCLFLFWALTSCSDQSATPQYRSYNMRLILKDGTKIRILTIDNACFLNYENCLRCNNQTVQCDVESFVYIPQDRNVPKFTLK